MGGRILIERLTCENTGIHQTRAYIRLMINDGIVAIGDVSDDGMATLESFV